MYMLLRTIVSHCIGVFVIGLLFCSGCRWHPEQNSKPHLNQKDEEMREALLQRWKKMQFSDPDSVLRLTDRLWQLEQPYDEHWARLNLYYRKSFLYAGMYHDYPTARVYVDSARAMLEAGSLSGDYLKARVYYIEGVYYSAVHNYDSAIMAYLSALDRMPGTTAEDSAAKSFIYSDLSAILYAQKSYRQAYTYFQPFIREAMKHQNLERDMAVLLNAYGYYSLCPNPAADTLQLYLFDAKHLYDSMPVASLYAPLLSSLSAYYFGLSQRDSGVYYARKAIADMRQNPLPHNHIEEPLLRLIAHAEQEGRWGEAGLLLDTLARATDTGNYSMADLSAYFRFKSEWEAHSGQQQAAFADLKQHLRLLVQEHQLERDKQVLQYEKEVQRLHYDNLLNAQLFEIRNQKIYVVYATIVAILTFLSSIYVFFDWKKKRMLEKKRWKDIQHQRDYEYKHRLLEERNRISRDMHDDLGTTLTATIMAIEAAEQFPDIKEYQTQVRDAVSKVYEQMNEIIWNLNERNDNIQSLNNYTIRFARNILSMAGIRFDWEEDVVDKQQVIPAFQRRVLYLAIKEIIHNIIKHAQATAVQMTVRVQEHQYHLCISDNGVGMAVSRKKKVGHIETGGYGLANVSRNIASYFGSVVWKDRPEGGTEVCIDMNILHQPENGGEGKPKADTKWLFDR